MSDMIQTVVGPMTAKQHAGWLAELPDEDVERLRLVEFEAWWRSFPDPRPAYADIHSWARRAWIAAQNGSQVP